MKVLHIGNVAMNGYNNAKFLRRKGIDAYVLAFDDFYIMSQPEWEDSDFEEEIKNHWCPDWGKVNLHGFKRPEWFIEYLTEEPVNISEFKFLKRSWRSLKNYLWFVFHIKEILELRKIIKEESLKYLNRKPFLKKKKTSVVINPVRIIKNIFSQFRAIKSFKRKYYYIKFLRGIVDKYDIIQANGTEPIIAMLAAPEKDLVSFEHGTMREILKGDLTSRLLTIAYFKSKKCIITNPDGISAAQRVGLENYTFIPHPIDTDKFRPRQTQLRNKLVRKTAAELIFFAPSRHDWTIKGNNKIIEAFYQYLKSAYKKTVLFFSSWGQEVERSKKYIRHLAIEKYIFWTDPLPKIKLSEYYNASDLVLDQFCLGIFGTTSPEAMACGKSVITWFDWKINKWAWTEKPPIVSAESSHEIFEAMKLLSQDESLRNEIGRKGRTWVEKYHNWELVADKQIAIYKEILNEKYYHQKN